MKNKIYIVFYLMMSILSCAQEGPDNLINPDFIISDYGVSLKDKAIGNYTMYACGPACDAYGYQNTGKISYQNTKLYFINGIAQFTEDLSIDIPSIKIIDQGYNSYPNYKKRDPIYIDKNKAYSGIYVSKVISELDDFTFFKGNFLIKNDTLAYLDQHGFYRLSNSKTIDKQTFTPITGHFFYDKNGVYYIENGYSSVGDKKISDYKKIQDINKISELKIKLDEDYCSINGIVYDISGNLSILDLDPGNINKILLNDYDGNMILYDKNNTYQRNYAHYSFNKVNCTDDLEKEGIHCASKNLKKITKIRETGFTEYHYDEKNKTIYFDNNKDLGFTEVSGNLYSFDEEYYFTDFDRFDTKLKQIKIWNPQINDYENLDLSQYIHIYEVTYWYKGNLYGNHSDLKHENFNKENARVLITDHNYYILNKDMIINNEDTNGLDLNSLKVLKLPNEEISDYLIGNGFLIYENQIIREIDTQNIQVLTNKVIKNDRFIIIDGVKYELKDFPFEIIVVN